MKYTPGYSVEEREQYWIKHINKARRYPFGVTAYCEHAGIEKNNYYQWFKSLRKKHPEWEDLSKTPSHHAMKKKAKKRKELPPTEVTEKAKNRRWSPAEKTRVLEEIDAAPIGTFAAILRREGIYSSAIDKWRAERAAGSLEPQKRGPKPIEAAEEIKRLKVELARSEKKLAKANALIDLQKKVSEILRTSLEESEDDG